MPELGDVEGFRRTVAKYRGSRVAAVDVLDAAALHGCTAGVFIDAIVGRTLGEPCRVGKWLSVPIGRRVIVFHFGMTGLLAPTDDTGPQPATRVWFRTSTGSFRFDDRRRLGSVHLAPSASDVAAIIGPIGPDALDISSEGLHERLATSRGSIKAALLDQGRLAGVGNFGSDEILWRARIRPDTTARSMTSDQWNDLHRALRGMLRATARVGHTPRGPTWLTGARGDPGTRCPRCAAELERDTVAGRTSVWCPRCQPARLN